MKQLMLGLAISLLCGHAFAQVNSARAKLYDQSGQFIGKVKFAQRKGGVVIRTEVQGLTPGFHGFHIHATGECIPPFTTAGGHFEQGEDTNHRDHNGDLPVLLVNSDGTAKAKFKTDRFVVADLFDAALNGNGRAVIIHADPDNYANIPTDRYTPEPDAATLSTGDAGSRVACGVIER